LAKAWKEKFKLNRVTTEMKNEVARKLHQRNPIKERSKKEKLDLGF
jgi:hypothetical protein